MIPEEIKNLPDVQALGAWDPECLLGGRFDRGELTLEIAPAKIVAGCDLLKTSRGYTFLADLTCCDGYPVEPRFRIAYHLYALERQENLRLAVSISGDDPKVDTVSVVWPTAGWFEREVFDLFGVVFTGHTDMRRILLPDGFEGHPLRKDYPVEGVR